MRCRTFQLAPAALLLFWLSAATALGQYGDWQAAGLAGEPAGPTIVGQGSASVERPATILRMHIELLGKGDTLEEALDKLKERRQAAAVQLKALKADPQSIEFGSPSLSNVESQQRRRLEAMVIERFSARGRELPEGLKVPKSFSVSVTLTAEWPLEAETPEQMLLAAESLQEKVKAADLAGTKDAEELSPEEEELAEEMSDMMGGFPGEEEVKPGEPHFLYVARISEQEGDKAFADAFADAKKQASRLAQAGGARLGPLVSLSGGGGGSTEFDDEYGYELQRYMRRLTGRHSPLGEPDDQDEAVASNPGRLVFTFYVRAAFRLEQ